MTVFVLQGHKCMVFMEPSVPINNLYRVKEWSMFDSVFDKIIFNYPPPPPTAMVYIRWTLLVSQKTPFSDQFLQEPFLF